MDKKEEILKAATPVFADKGYHATSMEDIAYAAGVAKGTLYLYYKSKAELFTELNFKLLEETDRWLDEASRIGGSLWDKIEYLVNSSLTYFTENKDVFSILQRETPLESVAVNYEAAERIKAIMKGRVGRLAVIFSEHRDEGEVSDEFSDHEAAFLCLNVMEGIVRRFLEGWEGKPVRNAEIALEFLKNGLSKKN